MHKLLSLFSSFPNAHTSASVNSVQSLSNSPFVGIVIIVVLAALVGVIYYIRTRPNQPLQWQTIRKTPLLTPVLVVALVAAAYYIGVLQTELRYTANPSVLAAQVATNPQATPAPTPLATIPPITAADHILGNKDAKVVIVEYSDLECPFCKEFHPTLQQLMNDYGGNIAWVYRHFPLPFHQNAEKEAEAAECVNEQGGNTAFWQFVDTIYQRTTSNGTGFALDALGPLAAEIGLNQDTFQQCLDSGKYAPKIQQDIDEGTAAGVNGTPTSFIVAKNGTVKTVPGALPYAQMHTIIDPLLK